MAQLLRQRLEILARQAVQCTECFETDLVQHALIDLPQPKPLGPRYASASPKVVILMINPGAGTGWADAANREMRQRLIAFRDGGGLDPVLEHQWNDMAQWGRGRFWRYFFSTPAEGGLGLAPDAVAFANIAWCATSNNRYPAQMLSRCFDLHTLPLLKLLAPNVVLLCGSATHRFGQQIRSIARPFELLHYAHRKGMAAQRAQFANPGLREALGI